MKRLLILFVLFPLFFGCPSVEDVQWIKKQELPEGMPDPGGRPNVNPVIDIDPVLTPPAPVIDSEPVPPTGDLKKHYEFYLDACCRVYAGDSGGSGVCYKIDNEYVYILTCRHVVGKNKTAKVEFWHDGIVTKKYPAITVKVLKADVAVIAVKCSEFKGRLPNAIPVAEKGPEPGDTIVSVGCPNLGWQTLFEGHVKEGSYRSQKSNGGFRSFKFAPPAKGGRSGSGVFMDGKIVGILWGSDRKTESLAVRCEDFVSQVNDLEAKDDDQPGGFFFTADWCRYCKDMKPIIEALKTEGFQIQEIDYDRNTAFAKFHNVSSLPTFVDRSGNTITGVRSAEELREFFSSQGDTECD
jgi:thiol-disulfide isomerase/thioredoxin